MATISRIDKIVGLFCRIASLFQDSFAKETYNVMDPTNQSHPIVLCVLQVHCVMCCSVLQVCCSVLQVFLDNTPDMVYLGV